MENLRGRSYSKVAKVWNFYSILIWLIKVFNFHHVIQIQEINFNKELTPTVHLTGKKYTYQKYRKYCVYVLIVYYRRIPYGSIVFHPKIESPI